MDIPSAEYHTRGSIVDNWRINFIVLVGLPSHTSDNSKPTWSVIAKIYW